MQRVMVRADVGGRRVAARRSIEHPARPDGVHVVATFFAYSPDSADGVTVAAADVNGDNLADVVTGTERGAPLVKVFDGRDSSVLSSFFAYNPRLGNGVYVAAVAARGPHR